MLKTKEDLVIAILLNYNQNDYTIKCVKSLLESDYNNLKILLVDNGSSDENYNELEQNISKDERVIFKRLVDNIGYAKGSNYGLEEGGKLDPTYFLILNNDTVIDKMAVTELVKTSKKYKDMARVTGKVYHYDEPEKLQFIAYKKIKNKKFSYIPIGVDQDDNGQFDSIKELDMMDDIFVLHPASLFKSIGGYSPYLWVNGVNIDISLRAINDGYKLVFSPNAKLWHKGSVSFGGRDMNPKLAFWNIQSKLILRYLHSDKATFVSSYFRILINDVTRTLFKSVYLKLFKGEDITQYAMAKLKAYSYFNRWVFNKSNNTGYNPY